MPKKSQINEYSDRSIISSISREELNSTGRKGEREREGIIAYKRTFEHKKIDRPIGM